MELIEQIKELVKSYDPSINGQGYWESGNYDDAYESGLDVGYQNCLSDIAKILGITLPKRLELEF